VGILTLPVVLVLSVVKDFDLACPELHTVSAHHVHQPKAAR